MKTKNVKFLALSLALVSALQLPMASYAQEATPVEETNQQETPWINYAPKIILGLTLVAAAYITVKIALENTKESIIDGIQQTSQATQEAITENIITLNTTANTVLLGAQESGIDVNTPAAEVIKEKAKELVQEITQEAPRKVVDETAYALISWPFRKAYQLVDEFMGPVTQEEFEQVEKSIENYREKFHNHGIDNGF